MLLFCLHCSSFVSSIPILELLGGGGQLEEKEGEFYLGRVEKRKREGKGEETWQVNLRRPEVA